MAKTYQTLVTEARALLQDTETEYRYSDDKLVAILNRGLNDLAKLRPDAMYDLYDANDMNVPEVITTGTPADDQILWSDTFNLERQFYSPLLTYIVALAELTEDEFTLEGRAVAFLEQFRTQLIGV